MAGYDDLLADIVSAIEDARRAAARSINAVMTATYWLVGQRIVEREQEGAARARYGEGVDRVVGDVLLVVEAPGNREAPGGEAGELLARAEQGLEAAERPRSEVAAVDPPAAIRMEPLGSGHAARHARDPESLLACSAFLVMQTTYKTMLIVVEVRSPAFISHRVMVL